jgi:hypothetical protein
MVSLLTLIIQIAGFGLGIYRIWPEAAALLLGSGPLTFMHGFQAGERILLSCSLVLLPFMSTLKAVMGSRAHATLTALVFSGISVVMAHVLQASTIDGYVFYLSQNRQWISLALPAGILFVVAVNWLTAFAEIRLALSGK